MSSIDLTTSNGALRLGLEDSGSAPSVRSRLLRPWLVYNLELVPNDICTPTERVCIDLTVLAVLFTLMYALSSTTRKVLGIVL